MVRAEEKDRIYVAWAETPAAEKEEPKGGLYAAVTRFLGEDAPERQ